MTSIDEDSDVSVEWSIVGWLCLALTPVHGLSTRNLGPEASGTCCVMVFGRYCSPRTETNCRCGMFDRFGSTSVSEFGGYRVGSATETVFGIECELSCVTSWCESAVYESADNVARTIADIDCGCE